MPELIEGPKEEDILKLVTVDQLKAQKRVVTNRENDFIKDCILDAWSWIDGPEGKCRRAVLPQIWSVGLDVWPRSPFRLPIHGARAITKVTSVVGGASADLAAGSFYGSPASKDGIDLNLFLRAGSALPALSAGDTVHVEFSAGWPTAEAVPRVFRRALRLVAAHFYDNREETFGDQRVSVVSRRIELGANELLSRYIVPLDYGRRC